MSSRAAPARCLDLPLSRGDNRGMQSGLVSITFRALAPEQIIDRVARAGLAGIEWGGDVHVPHGDLDRARAVGRMTRDAGIAVAAYGAYYRVGQSAAEGLPWERVLDTAAALEAPCVRVWAGTRGSQQADPAYVSAVAEEATAMAERAAPLGIAVAFEFHQGTLTDSNEAAARLLQQANHPNLLSLWQPIHGASVEHNLAGIEMLGRRLHHAHVFHWWPTARERHPLADGHDRWVRYVEALRGVGARWALLEFVKNDSVDQFDADARTLKALLAQ